MPLQRRDALRSLAGRLLPVSPVLPAYGSLWGCKPAPASAARGRRVLVGTALPTGTGRVVVLDSAAGEEMLPAAGLERPPLRLVSVATGFVAASWPQQARTPLVLGRLTGTTGATWETRVVHTVESPGHVLLSGDGGRYVLAAYTSAPQEPGRCRVVVVDAAGPVPPREHRLGGALDQVSGLAVREDADGLVAYLGIAGGELRGGEWLADNRVVALDVLSGHVRGTMRTQGPPVPLQAGAVAGTGHQDTAGTRLAEGARLGVVEGRAEPDGSTHASLSVYDAGALGHLTAHTLDEIPGSLVADTGARRVYWLGISGQRLWMTDTRSGATALVADLGRVGGQVIADGERVWVTHPDTREVSAVHPVTRRLARYAIGGAPLSLAAAA